MASSEQPMQQGTTHHWDNEIDGPVKYLQYNNKSCNWQTAARSELVEREAVLASVKEYIKSISDG